MPPPPPTHLAADEPHYDAAPAHIALQAIQFSQLRMHLVGQGRLQKANMQGWFRVRVQSSRFRV
jgi:hypothetical protein